MFKGLHHIGIVVHNLDESIKKYERLFQGKLKFTHTAEDHWLRLAFVEVGGVMLELLQPLSPGKGYIGEFLDKHGEGLNHIAFKVEHLEALLAEMKKAGVRLRDEKPRFRGGRFLIAFICREETSNIPVELVETRPATSHDDDPLETFLPER